jgi:hypothetical protein
VLDLAREGGEGEDVEEGGGVGEVRWSAATGGFSILSGSVSFCGYLQLQFR